MIILKDTNLFLTKFDVERNSGIPDLIVTLFDRFSLYNLKIFGGLDFALFYQNYFTLFGIKCLVLGCFSFEKGTNNN
jgi:hypothetical protein